MNQPTQPRSGLEWQRLRHQFNNFCRELSPSGAKYVRSGEKDAPVPEQQNVTPREMVSAFLRSQPQHDVHKEALLEHASERSAFVVKTMEWNALRVGG